MLTHGLSSSKICVLGENMKVKELEDPYKMTKYLLGKGTEKHKIIRHLILILTKVEQLQVMVRFKDWPLE